MMNKADFIISGVMKGGTTILYDFITEHPEVNKAKVKEVHYFTLNYDKGDEWYSDHFANNGNINGEASPTYFDLATSKIIPAMINRHNLNSKIIVILREPVERAISHYNHLVNINKNERLKKMGAERFFNLPYSSAISASNEYSSLLYHVLNFSSYSQKLLIYKEQFGDRLLVLNNEALRSDPYSTMSKVYRFIGVDDSFVSNNFINFKYSAGTSLNQLSKETLHKLREFFAEDVTATERIIQGL